MSRKRNRSTARRSSSIGKARRGRVTPPKTTRAPYWLVFTDCPGCPLCDLLDVADWPLQAESPRRDGPGLSFDQTPSRTWSDLR